YECIQDSKIMRLCESKNITANEIHILNMDYPGYTRNWKDGPSSKIKPSCHCIVDSASSKNVVVTMVRSFVLFGENNIVIQGENEQCTVGIGFDEYNTGQEVHDGSLPMHFVYNYGKIEGLYLIWFNIKSDDGGDITLQCEESEATVDDTLPQVCQAVTRASTRSPITTTATKHFTSTQDLSTSHSLTPDHSISQNTKEIIAESTTQMTTYPKQTRETVPTSESSTVRGDDTTTLLHVTNIYEDLKNGETNKKEDEDYDLGLIIGCVLAVVVVCVVV
ncbi:unnamed protein product, partial [Owenia fusiformis]